MMHHQGLNGSREAATSAVRWNAALAAGELAAAAFTGNIGFIGEAFHNAADSISFFAKRRAMDAEKTKSRKLRKLAAGIFAFGGALAFTGAAMNQASNHNENASDIAVGIAFAAASVNTLIARKAHAANDHHHNEVLHEAHADSKLHAITDAGTGWLYVGGLIAEHHIPGAANYTVMINGAVATSAAAVMLRRVRQTSR